MRNWRVAIWTWGLVCLGLPLGPAVGLAQGGYGGAFLRLGVGPRALGMGGAFTGLADDNSAIYWNPAGLGQQAGPRVLFAFGVLSLDRRQGFVSYSQPAGPAAHLAMAWFYTSVNDIDGRDSNGQSTRLLSDSQNAFFFSFVPRLSHLVTLGINMKVFYQKLVGQSASGFGLDFGLWTNPLAPLTVGLALRNLLAKVTWDTGDLYLRQSRRVDAFPIDLALGVGYRLWQKRLLVTIDGVKVAKGHWGIRAGTELQLGQGLAVRAGLNDNRLAFGGSLEVAGLFQGSQVFHYAFLPDPLHLSGTHQIAWDLRF